MSEVKQQRGVDVERLRGLAGVLSERGVEDAGKEVASALQGVGEQVRAVMAWVDEQCAIEARGDAEGEEQRVVAMIKGFRKLGHDLSAILRHLDALLLEADIDKVSERSRGLDMEGNVEVSVALSVLGRIQDQLRQAWVANDTLPEEIMGLDPEEDVERIEALRRHLMAELGGKKPGEMSFRAKLEALVGMPEEEVVDPKFLDALGEQVRELGEGARREMIAQAEIERGLDNALLVEQLEAEGFSIDTIRSWLPLVMAYVYARGEAYRLLRLSEESVPKEEQQQLDVDLADARELVELLNKRMVRMGVPEWFGRVELSNLTALEAMLAEEEE